MKDQYLCEDHKRGMCMLESSLGITERIHFHSGTNHPRQLPLYSQECILKFNMNQDGTALITFL